MKKLIIQSIVAVAVISAYAYSTISNTPTIQKDYSRWMKLIAPSLTDAATIKNPKIVITLHSKLTAFKGRWAFELQADSKDRDIKQNTLRLLELAEASEIFSYTESESTDNGLSFFIESDDKKFQSKLSSTQIAENISVQTLLQLVPLYSEDKVEKNENT